MPERRANIRPELIEAAIVQEYAKVELIAKLKEQQQRLIRLHAEEGDNVSPDAFRAERARMAGEIKEAEKSLAETETRFKLEEDLCAALDLAGNVQAILRSGPMSRRGAATTRQFQPHQDQGAMGR